MGTQPTSPFASSICVQPPRVARVHLAVPLPHQNAVGSDDHQRMGVFLLRLSLSLNRIGFAGWHSSTELDSAPMGHPLTRPAYPTKMLCHGTTL